MRLALIIYVEGRENRGYRAAFKKHVSREIGVDFNVYLLTAARLGRDKALGEALFRHRADALRPAQKIYKRRHIVRPHIQHRAAAPFIIELRIRMPGLMPVADHGCIRADHIPDKALVDKFPAGLDACTHIGVRRAAEVQSVLFRDRYELIRFRHIYGKRLFRIHMLP